MQNTTKGMSTKDKLVVFLESSYKAFFAIVGVALIGTVAYSFYKKSKTNAEKSAFSKLYEIESKYLEKKSSFEKSKAPENAKQDGSAKDNKSQESATGDITKDYADIPAQLEKFILENKKTNAALQASLWLSEIYEDYKMDEKAAEAITSGLEGGSSSGLVYSMAVIRLGNLWVKANKCDKAISEWKKLIHEKSIFTTQASLKTALCQRELGKKEDAKMTLQELISKHPSSPEAASAKKYIKLLDYKGVIEAESSKAKSEAKES